MEQSRKEIQTPEKEENTINKQQGSGIRCPDCGGSTKVIRTMPLPEESKQIRLRKCDMCGLKIESKERISTRRTQFIK